MTSNHLDIHVSTVWKLVQHLSPARNMFVASDKRVCLQYDVVFRGEMSYIGKLV